jgi:hypothetical protein
LRRSWQNIGGAGGFSGILEVMQTRAEPGFADSKSFLLPDFV